MKRFDSDSTYQRLKQRLEIKEEWAKIADKGTIDNILKTEAEGFAELARYIEYLYQEKKWKNARNITSITHMSDLVGYKRKLPKSAIGYVVVSHTDVNGNNRLANYGTDFFDLDASSDYDDLTQNSDATDEEKAALVPWTANESYSIYEGTTFKSASGVSFFATETVKSRALKQPFSVIKADSTKYAAFIAAGGWNGIKYLKVPVMQGEKVSTELGEASGSRFECFTIDSLSVENASNSISRKYFTVSVKPYAPTTLTGNDDTETWELIENIKLAGPYDKVFEIKILDDSGKVMLKFGDGITGQMLPEKALITVNYVNTKGYDGNISDKFQITSMSYPDGYTMVDPRTNSQETYLNCTNISPIMGGLNIEDESDVKLNAPVYHLKSYTTSSKKNYLKQIEDKSVVDLLHFKVFNSETVDSESYGSDDTLQEYVSKIDTDTSVLQEITATKNSLVISALKSNGEKIEDPETELLVPLRQELDDFMSVNDTLEFIQPNLIQIRPNITITTTSSIQESDIKDELVPNITGEFSIFNKDFGKKYFMSEIIDIAHNLSYANSVDCFLEAKVEADLEPTILTMGSITGNDWLNYVGNTTDSMEKYNNTVGSGSAVYSNDYYESLFAFDFSFDEIFAQDTLHQGFKNYKNKAKYVLRADIIFDDYPENSKTLFLFDNRYDLNGTTSLEEAYLTDGNSTVASGLLNSEVTYNDGDGNSLQMKWPINESENFNNLLARTAQFELISKITSDKFMEQAKNFSTSPFEIRPLYVDEYGQNKKFTVKDGLDINVDGVSTQDYGKANSINSYFYKKNWQYWNHCKIEFYENYDDPTSENYAKGRIIVPIKKILSSSQIASLKTLFENSGSLSDQEPEIKKLLQGNVHINVYAQPLATSFECNNDYDIIYSNKDNIQVEKNFIIKE